MFKDVKIQYLALFLFAFALYGNTLQHDYALDDYIVITGNSFTKQGIKGIGDIFTHDAFVGAYGEALELSGGRYRPLSIVMFALEFEVFGLDPFYGHFFNVLLFALISCFVLKLMRRIIDNKKSWIPFVVALLFVAHPIHTEVVANIKSRDEILSFFFLIPVLLSTMQTRTIFIYIIGPIFFFLALLSKENAITFLGVIPLTLWYFTSDKVVEISKKLLPFVVVAVLYLIMRDSYAGMIGDRITKDIMDDPYLNASMSEKLATIAYTVFLYLKLLCFPITLASDYSFNQISLIKLSDYKAIGSILFIVSILFYAFVGLNNKTRISYSILFFVLTFSIVSNVLFNVGVSMAERFVFLPSLGFCMLIGLLSGKLSDMKFTKSKLLVGILLSFVLLTYSYKTIARNSVWKNNFTLYQEDVKHVPNSARIHLYYGIELITKYNKTNDNKILDKAINEILISIKINPLFHHAHYNLAVAYEKAKDFDNAILAYKSVLELQPRHIKSNLNLGLLLGKVKNDFDGAIYHFTSLLNTTYTNAQLFDNLGIAYAMKGDFISASDIFQKGLLYHPKNAKLHFNLGLTYSRLGDETKSKQLFEKAFELDPSLKTTN